MQEILSDGHSIFSVNNYAYMSGHLFCLSLGMLTTNNSCKMFDAMLKIPFVYNLWVLAIAIVNIYTQEYVDRKYVDMENLTVHKYGWLLLPVACMNAELLSNQLDPSLLIMKQEVDSFQYWHKQAVKHSGGQIKCE